MFTENLQQQIIKHKLVQSPEWSSLLQQQIPNKKNEDWKYTDVSFLNDLDFHSDIDHIYTHIFLNESGALVFTPDTEEQTVPLIEGCRILRGEEAVAYLGKNFSESSLKFTSNYFGALCEASKPETLVLVVDESWDAKKTLKLQFEALNKKSMLSHLNLCLVLENHVSLKLHETFMTPDTAALNLHLKYFIGENASLTSVKVDKAKQGRILSTQNTRVEKNGIYKTVHFTSGAEWVRHTTYVGLFGEAAHADLAASYLVGEGQFVDHHTFVDHQVGLTTSQQLFSGVIAHQATGVYNGKVWIQRDAQKSHAEQLSRNLLLSKTAQVNTKPELLIDADDVKAKHGATIGQMDQEELFYMQSRGLTLQQAREMVLKSFVFGVSDQLPPDLKSIFIDNAIECIHRFVDGIRNV